MSLKMGRMTKRNRTKYRRRAYEAGMFRRTPGPEMLPAQPGQPIARTPRDLGDKRAA